MRRIPLTLELFLTTVIEYKRFSNQLPLKNDEDLIETHDEKDYVAIHTRLILLRKYASVGKNNNVYLGNLIDHAMQKFPQNTDFLIGLKNKLIQINEQSLEQLLFDGTKLNLYQTIEDVMYGLHLHADEARITRLCLSNELLRTFCTKNFVLIVESIVFELYDFLIKNNISDLSSMKPERASVIHLETDKTVSQDIKNSPFWQNLRGHDATGEELQELIKEYTLEENLLVFLSILFLDELKKENPSLELLRSMVYISTLKDWGDFSQATNFYRGIPNPGLSSRVRYNEKKDVAYIRILPNTEDIFIIETPQIITDLYQITLMKDNQLGVNDSIFNGWKVFAMGAPVDPYNV